MKNTKTIFLKNILLCFISFLMILSLGNILLRVNTLVHKNHEVKEKLENLQEEKKNLKKTVNNFQSPEYVIHYAREKYMFTKEDEEVIQLPDNNQINTFNRGE